MQFLNFQKMDLVPIIMGIIILTMNSRSLIFSLLAADYHLKKGQFSIDDVKAVFVAALFHDFDPLKRFDKPHEDVWKPSSEVIIK